MRLGLDLPLCLVALVELEMERYLISDVAIIEQRDCYATSQYSEPGRPFCSFNRFPYQTEWNVESIVISMQ